MKFITKEKESEPIAVVSLEQMDGTIDIVVSGIHNSTGTTIGCIDTDGSLSLFSITDSVASALGLKTQDGFIKVIK